GRGQRETLAEVLQGLVGREPRADRRDLEEHSARLAKVDGAEVKAIDDRRRRSAALDRSLAPRFVLLGRRGPCDVVHGAGALNATLAGLVVHIERAALLAPRLVARLPGRLEVERAGEKLATRCGVGREGPHTGEASQA